MMPAETATETEAATGTSARATGASARAIRLARRTGTHWPYLPLAITGA